MPADPAGREGGASDNGATRDHIRGSSLLLAGRLVSLAINFAVQVLIVRYLGKGEFGAFAYALAAGAMGSSIVALGLDKAIVRYVPIYLERREYDRMFGAIALVFVAVAAMGVLVIAATLAALGVWGTALIADPLAVKLVMIAILMAPLDALDAAFQGLFAVFAKPKAIFWRRNVLAPSLRLLAIVTVIATSQGPLALATGYVLASVVGVATYALMLMELLRRNGLLRLLTPRSVRFPTREVFGFAIPLLTSDIVLVLKSSMAVMFLGYFSSTLDVAEFKAVVPVAGLNLVVIQSFKYLYSPMAARLFARGDGRGINDLYWRTAIWIAVMSFPVFALTFSLARPLTVMLFGSRYVDAGALLAVLAVGDYFGAALGFNSYTLRVYGKVRYLVIIDVASAVLNLVLSLTLIPLYGAMGAALAVTGTMVGYNLFNHAGLQFGTDVDLFDWRYLRLYLAITLLSVGVMVAEQLLDPPFALSVALIAAASLLLVRLHRGILGIYEMFPELRRIRVLRPLFGV